MSSRTQINKQWRHGENALLFGGALCPCQLTCIERLSRNIQDNAIEDLYTPPPVHTSIIYTCWVIFVVEIQFSTLQRRPHCPCAVSIVRRTDGIRFAAFCDNNKTVLDVILWTELVHNEQVVQVINQQL